jgi:hypothetical protein
MLTLRAAVLAILLLLAAAAPAAADTVSLSFNDTSGASDPVYNIGRTLVIRGNAPVQKRLYVKVRAPGGAPCAASPSSDSGAGLDTDDGDTIDLNSYSDGFQGQYNGDFAKTVAGRWSVGSGTYMFCSWLAPDSSTPSTPITQMITFRMMAGSISGTVPSFVAGGGATASVTGSSEGPLNVYAKVRKAGGAPCAAAYSADSGTSVLENASVNGAFAFSPRITASSPGDYVLCLWLAGSVDGTQPVAGPQPVLFNVQRPCVVPTVGSRMRLKGAQKRLVAAGCVAGTVTFKRSSSVRRGRVIRFKPRTGKRLAPGSKIAIVVSRGR